MKNYEKIWEFAKWRFLQNEATKWTIGNRILEIILIGGVLLALYFGFYAEESNSIAEYFGIILTLLVYGVIQRRVGQYIGYFDGYEKGFLDAASRNLVPSVIVEGEALDSVMKDIDESELNLTEEESALREKSVIEGFEKLLGLILTWRKIN